ncbi:peptidoglycan-binding domain-containing protein [Aristaeella lactis]|nr:peptidoglycan-binding domain-containing protein [Aristaeella lactis]
MEFLYDIRYIMVRNKIGLGADKMKKGKLFIILILAVIVVAAFGGKGGKNATTATKSLSSVDTGIKGKDSELTATPKITEEPTATPSPTPEPTMVPELKSGSKGDEVTALQELLVQYGYLSGKASGKYDNATIKAVKDFQINNRLEETGKCTEEVWEKITNWPKQQETVYKSKKGKVYHSRSDCSGMKTATSMTLSDALRKGLTPCSHCH